MFDQALVRPVFDEAHTFEAFLAHEAHVGHAAPWFERYEQLELTSEQTTFVESFTRRINILCVTGPWCGDCALQGAAMARIANANPAKVDLRFVSRDDAAHLQTKYTLNKGLRVPITFFMAEDFAPVSIFGDRTLSRYRSMARKALGDDAVPAPAPADPARTVLDEVMAQVERVYWLLRLSGRLRQLHND